MPPEVADRSNGYEAVAVEYMTRRGRRDTGRSTVGRWSRALPPGGSVLDLGCGHGAPLTAALVADGFSVYGVDASPSLVAACRARLPDARVVCEPVEDSRLFDRAFDGILAWGLLFLLADDLQRRLVPRIAEVLRPGGRWLFTAPVRAGAWPDALTGRESRSLGADVYRSLIAQAGLVLVGQVCDEGDNDYYEAMRPATSTPAIRSAAPGSAPAPVTRSR